MILLLDKKLSKSIIKIASDINKYLRNVFTKTISPWYFRFLKTKKHPRGRDQGIVSLEAIFKSILKPDLARAKYLQHLHLEGQNYAHFINPAPWSSKTLGVLITLLVHI